LTGCSMSYDELEWCAKSGRETAIALTTRRKAATSLFFMATPCDSMIETLLFKCFA
jgi:hypothetical protein